MSSKWSVIKDGALKCVADRAVPPIWKKPPLTLEYVSQLRENLAATCHDTDIEHAICIVCDGLQIIATTGEAPRTARQAAIETLWFYMQADCADLVQEFCFRVLAQALPHGWLEFENGRPIAVERVGLL